MIGDVDMSNALLLNTYLYKDSKLMPLISKTR